MTNVTSSEASAAVPSGGWGDQRRKFHASSQTESPRGVRLTPSKQSKATLQRARRGHPRVNETRAATTAGNAPGDSQTASQETAGKLNMAFGVVVRVAVKCHAESKRMENPKPESPAAGEESRTATRAGTKGARPRQARAFKARSQQMTLNQATMMCAFCQPRGPATA
jgi:hypothetical protein